MQVLSLLETQDASFCNFITNIWNIIFKFQLLQPGSFRISEGKECAYGTEANYYWNTNFWTQWFVFIFWMTTDVPSQQDTEFKSLILSNKPKRLFLYSHLFQRGVRWGRNNAQKCLIRHAFLRHSVSKSIWVMSQWKEKFLSNYREIWTHLYPTWSLVQPQFENTIC